LVYDAGFAVGSVIDALMIQPALTPAVTIDIIETDAANSSVTLKATVDGPDSPFEYRWEQLEGEDATIFTSSEETTKIALPAEATGPFGFLITVTDASDRLATDYVEISLPLP
jgi:hypothetical protein